MSVFEEGPSVSKVISGGSMTFFLAMIAGVFAWIFGVIITRADIGLGEEAYGIFITGQAIIAIIGCVTWGINQSIQKYVAEYLVIDKKKAELYARNGAIGIIILGTIICVIFIVIGIVIFPIDSIIGLLCLLISPAILIGSVKDGILGNIAAIQRFDYVAVINACIGVGLFLVGVPLVLFVIKPNPAPIIIQLAPLTILGLSCSATIQVILSWYFGRKCLPFNIGAIYKGPKDRHIMWKVVKYGFYCTIPTIILSGSILWIPALLISIILGASAPALFGLIVGYSMVMLTLSFMGWPMISAVSEAHAMGDQKLIDDYFRSSFKSTISLLALFLAIFIGLARPILEVFHGLEYVNGQFPFIILAIGVSLLAIEFVCCTVLIGVGEGRKTSYVFIFITLSEIILTILFLNTFPDVNYAAPCAILISSLAMFPFIPKLLKPHTSVRFPWDSLSKSIVSILIALGIGFLIDYFIFSFISILGIIIGAIIFIVTYIFSMLFLAGYGDDDFETIYSSLETFNLKGLKPLVEIGEKITHKSPFYRKENNILKKEE